ncbi:MAG: Deoxyuridine 5'-triphosphate nucleotidohydrolase [Hyphomicrobiaceae bacterium hypho_1]
MSQFQHKSALKIKRLTNGEGLELPCYQTLHSSGLDLSAAIPVNKPVVILPGQRRLIPSGFAIALEYGFEAQVRPRSGLALDHGITVLNSPGTIDADYRGEVKIVLINLGQQAFTVKRGQRIAQLVISPITTVVVEIVNKLNTTVRGTDGFGSTSKNL